MESWGLIKGKLRGTLRKRGLLPKLYIYNHKIFDIWPLMSKFVKVNLPPGARGGGRENPLFCIIILLWHVGFSALVSNVRIIKRYCVYLFNFFIPYYYHPYMKYCIHSQRVLYCWKMKMIDIIVFWCPKIIRLINYELAFTYALWKTWKKESHATHIST